MAIRTSPTDVQDTLMDLYDGSADLTGFIAAGNSLTNKVATNDTDSLLDSDDLELIERYLAAHFYGVSDQVPQSKGTGRANASFRGQTAMGLEFTQFGQMAMTLDVTGYLSKLNKQSKEGKLVAGGSWLGTRYKNDVSQRASDQ